MKLRATLLLLASALLTESLAGAATTDPARTLPLPPASAPVAVAPSAPASLVSLASLACVPNASKAALALPVPFEPRSYVEICGSCSVPACRGAVQGTVGCSSTNPYARCLDVYGVSCPADGQDRCYCWSGPLP